MQKLSGSEDNPLFSLPDFIRYQPVLLILSGFITGILVCETFPWAASFGWMILAAASIGLLACFFLRKPCFVSLVLFFFALGYLSFSSRVIPELSENHLIHFTDGAKWEIEGVVKTHLRSDDHFMRFVVSCESLSRNNRTIPVTGLLRVSADIENPMPAQGAHIRFISKIRWIYNFKNPASFDFRRYMAFQSIYARAYAGKQEIQVLNSPAQGVSSLVSGIRNQVGAKISATTEPLNAGLMRGLLLGETARIPESVREDFIRAGAAHILAISGLHMGMVAGVFFFLFRYLFSFSRFCLRHDLTRTLAGFFTLFPVFFYAVLAGMSPSVQRASLMVCIFLLGFSCKRRGDGLNTLAVAACVILFIHPPALFSISFQLSFAAVFWIIAGINAFSGKTPPLEKRFIFHRLKTYVLVCLLAFFGTLPIVALHFHRISLMGLVSNFLIIPFVLPVIFSGLAGMAFFPVIPFASDILFAISGIFASACLHLTDFFSGFPLTRLHPPVPTGFEILLYYALMGWILVLVKRSRETPAEAIPWMLRKKHLIWGVLCLLIAGDILFWVHTRFFHKNLIIHFLDVGRGNAALVEIPGGKTMMIDGGGFYNNEIFDMGEAVLLPFLMQKRIYTIDYMVLTHPDSDHMNGFVFLVRHLSVGCLWSNNQAPKSASHVHFLETLRENKVPVLPGAQVFGKHTIGELQLRVISPFPDDALFSENNDNNLSLVIQLKFGEMDFLFPGDIEEKAEAQIAEQYGKSLQSEALLAPHHGSRTSSTNAFLHCVSPKVIVISTKNSKHIKNPHPEVLKRYRRYPVRVLRTDYSGAIRMKTDGKKVMIHPYCRYPEDFSIFSHKTEKNTNHSPGCKGFFE